MGPGPVAAGAQPLLVWGMRAVPPPPVSSLFPFPPKPPVLGSWSWKTGRAGCSRSSASGWRWKVGGAGRAWGRLGQAPCLRPAEDSPVWFCSDHLKTEEELAEEKRILNEMLEVVEQRDALVALLEEQRLREKEEDKDLEAAMLSKGFSLHWS